MTLEDYLQIGLAIVALIVIPRAIWRAWTRPAAPDDDRAPRRDPPPVELPPAIRWLVELIKRPFMVYDDPPVMSSGPAAPAAAADMQVVSIPVSGMEYQPGGVDMSIADIDAAKGSIPPGWRDITTNDLIVALAVLRGPDGKARYSANKIYELVGGDRNAVTALIREVRAGPPVPRYQELDEEARPAVLSKN